MENNKNENELSPINNEDENVVVSHLNSASKWKSKEAKKFYLFAGIAVLCVIVVLAVSLYIKSDRVGKALDIKQYERFQIVTSLSVTELESEEETQQEEYSDEVYDDGEYYYDENGNLVNTTDEQEVDIENTDDSYEMSTIKFDGNTMYDSYREYYKYTRGGEEFVVYYYEDILSNFGSNKQESDGEWIEVYAKNYNIKPSFDVNVLYNYEKSDFKKVEDYYIPKENTKAVFFDVLQISQTRAENYADCGIKFYFDSGKLEKIIAEYIYDNSQKVVQSYKFTYEDEKIEIPKADKKYDINDKLIYDKTDKEE